MEIYSFKSFNVWFLFFFALELLYSLFISLLAVHKRKNNLPAFQHLPFVLEKKTNFSASQKQQVLASI